MVPCPLDKQTHFKHIDGDISGAAGVEIEFAAFVGYYSLNHGQCGNCLCYNCHPGVVHCGMYCMDTALDQIPSQVVIWVTIWSFHVPLTSVSVTLIFFSAVCMIMNIIVGSLPWGSSDVMEEHIS